MKLVGGPVVPAAVVLLVMPASLAAQSQYTIATVAGGGPLPGVQAISAAVGKPPGVAVDSSGNVYYTNAASCQVFRMTPYGEIDLIAGNGACGYGGDGGVASSASLNKPTALAVNNSGDLFIADELNNRVRKVSLPDGVITTVAGNGSSATSGDGGPAVSAGVPGPCAMTVDPLGNVFVAECTTANIRKVDTASGLITKIANIMPAHCYTFSASGIAADQSGNVYVAAGPQILRIYAATGSVTKIAGLGDHTEPVGDGGPATSAGLWYPSGLALDFAGNLYIADMYNCLVRKVVTSTGIISTVAGTITVFGTHRVGACGYSGDGGSATSAWLHYPLAVAADALGNLFIADTDNNRIRKVTASAGTISTVAGNGAYSYSGDGGTARNAVLYNPSAVAIDATGSILIADTANNRIRKVNSSDGTISTIAGNGSAGFSGDGGPATSASLNNPSGIAVDSIGNVFLADTVNHRIRKIDRATGTISTVAGAGGYSYSGDGGPATSAKLNHPQAVAVDAAGNLFIADRFNSRIRKVTAATGVISTVAGADNLSAPSAVALDTSGNLFIADTHHHQILRVDAATGAVTKVAGNKSIGYSGDGGPATSATLSYPYGVAVDASGNVFIADNLGSSSPSAAFPIQVGAGRIRRVAASGGTISTVAGDGSQNFSAVGLATDSAGNVFAADYINRRILRLSSTVQTPPVIGAVVNGATFTSGIQSGSWASVMGTNLSTATRAWRGDEIVNGQLPRSLDGVTVSVDGQLAAICFISPGQINFQVPDVAKTGSVNVVVANSKGTSSPAAAEVRRAAPGLFVFEPGGGKYPAAVIARPDGGVDYLGPAGLYGTALASRPALPGESIELFGTGFGPSSPAVPAGQTFPSPTPLTDQVVARIGAATATVTYAGIVSPGLVQINVVIPAVGAGEQALSLTVGGTPVQSGLVIAVGSASRN
jgi:uncharacterized protein (TIGR03437 family)